MGGAVVAPAIATRWHGFRGTSEEGRVFRNGEPCRVSTTDALDHALVATGFPPNRDESPANNFASFERVKRRALAVRRCGAAAIDLCFVADGTYDAYWERRLRLWDLAAGAGLVLAAGGAASAIDGGPARWTHGHIAVSNGLVHDALLDAIRARGEPVPTAS
jgi:myo-inositol-1(or 4)-monophosphatase